MLRHGKDEHTVENLDRSTTISHSIAIYKAHKQTIFLAIRDRTHGYCLLECCYSANGAIIFPAELLFGEAAHNVASTLRKSS